MGRPPLASSYLSHLHPRSSCWNSLWTPAERKTHTLQTMNSLAYFLPRKLASDAHIMQTPQQACASLTCKWTDTSYGVHRNEMPNAANTGRGAPAASPRSRTSGDARTQPKAVPFRIEDRLGTVPLVLSLCVCENLALLA